MDDKAIFVFVNCMKESEISVFIRNRCKDMGSFPYDKKIPNSVYSTYVIGWNTYGVIMERVPKENDTFKNIFFKYIMMLLDVDILGVHEIYNFTPIVVSKAFLMSVLEIGGV